MSDDDVPRRFVLITAGRSGSNFLRHALESHPSIACYGEVLEPDADQSEFEGSGMVVRRRTGREPLGRYLESTVLSGYPVDARAVGFKLKHYHMERTKLAALIEHRQWVVVQSFRRNLLAQSISFSLAARHEFLDWIDDQSGAGVYCRQVQVDPSEVVARASYYSLCRARYAARFRASPFLEIAYEECCRADPDGRVTVTPVLSELLSMLGVPYAPLVTQVSRQKRTPYRSLVRNLDDVLAAFTRAHPRWAWQAEEVFNT